MSYELTGDEINRLRQNPNDATREDVLHLVAIARQKDRRRIRTFADKFHNLIHAVTLIFGFIAIHQGIRAFSEPGARIFVGATLIVLAVLSERGIRW